MYPVLIASHAKAADLWPITHHFIRKNWPDHPPIYLGANGEADIDKVPEGWQLIDRGVDRSFSRSLAEYLDAIESEYIILMLDDFAILEEVSNERLEKTYRFVREHDAVYLRLVPNPPGDLPFDHDFMRIAIEKRPPYATSLQIAIWKRDFLRKLLEYDFNPWEFEVRGGKTEEALANASRFFVAKEPLIRYTHFVEKGKFFPFVRYWKDKGVPIDTTRDYWTEEEVRRMQGSQLRRFVRISVPAAWRNRIRVMLGLSEL
ncbi:hypothetical protein [Nitratifractor sp.]|uniref:hypothetical protein n=1 Tax=Nitratifractor sp. TaxID=2268144 RepID=UPI0025D77547|nr:hypothetical protein [Nitratifractor sp.]